jgi:DNA-binding MarR family transcriptional regulator
MLDRFAKFSYSVSEIHRCWHKLAAEELAPYGLNSPHAIYLKTLFDAEPEGITAAQLGEICGKDKADVSRMVAILENRGLVRKVAVGKNMYRAKLVLTEAGREAAEHVRSRAAVAVELAGSGLSEEERENFYKALALITENLRKLSKNGLPQG